MPNKKKQTMSDVAALAMNVNKFKNAMKDRRKESFLNDRETMLQRFLEVTKPLPQKPYYPPPSTSKAYKRVLRLDSTDDEGEVVDEMMGEEEEDREEISGVSSDEDFGNLDEDQRRQKQLEEFYRHVIYELRPAPKTSQRTAELAKPKKMHLIGTYKEHKDVLDPPERAKRLKRMVREFEAITTEQLEEYFRKKEAKRKDAEKIREMRQQFYSEMLTKLEYQTREKILDDVYHKFSTYIAKCAVEMEKRKDMYPANVDRLICCLQSNIYLTCKISPEEQQFNGSLYRAIARSLAWIIVETLYVAQTTVEKAENKMSEHASESPSEENPEKKRISQTHNMLRKRAKIAAKKAQVKKQGAKKALFAGPPPRIDELIKLSNLIGCR